MLEDKVTTPAAPRYVRATVISTLSASVIPAALVSYALHDFQHGAPVEGSEAGGFLIVLVHILFAVSYVAIAYPWAAWYLHKRQQFSKQLFYKTLFLWLALLSILLSAILAAADRDLSSLFLAPGTFVLLALFALPFRPIWWKFA